MTSGGNTLGKSERLSGKKSIVTLLADGRWGAYGHFRYCWLSTQEACCPSSQKNAHQGSTLPALPEPAASGIALPIEPAASGKGPVCGPQGAASTGIALPIEPAASGKGPVCGPQGAASTGIALPMGPGSERPGRILISVPKRFFKRAVKRNLLKRRIREAYRVRKICGVDILFQYNSAEMADFSAISADVAAILERIAGCLTEGCSPSSQKNAHQACTLPSGNSEP